MFLIKTKKKVIAASRRQLLEVGSTRTYLHSRTNTSNNATTVDSTTPHGNKLDHTDILHHEVVSLEAGMLLLYESNAGTRLL